MRLSLKSTHLPGAGPSALWWEVSGSWLLIGLLNEGHTVGLEMLQESSFTETNLRPTRGKIICREQKDIS